jgi:hypothetical protein
MMTLAQASLYFDRTPVYDSYTGAYLFSAQLDVYDDTKRDAHTAYRRVLSVKPGTTIPAGRVVDALGRHWIVGNSEPDGLADIHREKYVLAQSNSRLKVSTLGEYLTGVSHADVWSAVHWSKDAKQTETSSDQPQMHDVVLPAEVNPRNVLWSATEAFLTLSPRPMPSGLHTAFCLKLDTQVETATVQSRVYDPVAGSYAASAGVTYPMLKVRWQSLFEYGSQADERYQEGDVSVVLPQSATINTSSLITVGGVTYSVLSVDTLVDSQVAHCRKV